VYGRLADTRESTRQILTHIRVPVHTLRTHAYLTHTLLLLVGIAWRQTTKAISHEVCAESEWCSVRACVRAGVRVCMHAGGRACVRACVRVRVLHASCLFLFLSLAIFFLSRARSPAHSPAGASCVCVYACVCSQDARSDRH